MFQPQVYNGLMASVGDRDLPALLYCSEEQLLGCMGMCLWEQGEPGLSHQSKDPKWSLSHLEAQKVMA